MNTLLKIALSVVLTGGIVLSFALAPLSTFITFSFFSLGYCCYGLIDSCY